MPPVIKAASARSRPKTSTTHEFQKMPIRFTDVFCELRYAPIGSLLSKFDEEELEEAEFGFFPLTCSSAANLTAASSFPQLTALSRLFLRVSIFCE